MPVEIRVPQLGESVVEATVGKWLKKEGDQVEAGEPLVELETEKVSLEVAAESAGVLTRIDKQEGDTVHVGEVLGAIGDGAVRPSAEGEAESQPAPSPAPAPTAEAPEPPPPPAPAAAPAEEEVEEEEGEPARGPAASPSARRLIEEHGLDVAQIRGSGPGGRVVREDVLAFLDKQREADAVAPPPPVSEPVAPAQPAPPQAEAPAAPSAPPVPGREERVRLSRRRLTIARRLVEAQQTAAMLTTFNEADMSAVMELRRRRQPAFLERHGIKLGFMSFFTKAVVAALKAFPNFNAELQGDELVLKRYYDIGIAVDTEGGLVVPVVRNADAKNFAEIEREIAELAAKARENRLTMADLQGGTFTITNGGIFGSLLSTPILNVPQVGILGMHRIQERPVVVDGKVVVRPMMYLALTYDHRVVDGREAVQFLVRVKELIEDPESLLLEA